ncbi:degenerin del-1-like [Dreissena polymorpha]|uniref:degenerin del-1-like n=1 Tax=Dreissena polymorpha TaxID=45954 RepID=UPI002265163B|nr:degenerin del-1-like [Dreissena polymorpha]
MTASLVGPHVPLLSMVKRRKLAWFGNVTRHESQYMTVLQGTLEGGRIQNKSWMDNVKELTSLPMMELLSAAHNKHLKFLFVCLDTTLYLYCKFQRVLLDALCDRDALICQTLLENIKDTQGFKNNFLKLNVYYEDLNFQNITESPQITIHQFLSDVGGTIGLWIGLSILSLCELVQLFAELCNYGIHKTIKERRHETERHSRRSDRSHIESNGKQVGEHTAETKMATNQTRAN